jgi:hypothetical protein
VVPAPDLGASAASKPEKQVTFDATAEKGDASDAGQHSLRDHRKTPAHPTIPEEVPANPDEILTPRKTPAALKIQAKHKGDQDRKRAAEIKQAQEAALAEARAALESGDVDRIALAVKVGNEVGLGKKDPDFVAASDKLASLRPGSPELSVPATATPGAVAGAGNINVSSKAGLDGAGGEEPPITTSVREMDSNTAQVAAVLIRCSEALDTGDADTAFAAFTEFNDLRMHIREEDLAKLGWSPAIIHDLETRVTEQKTVAQVEDLCAGPTPFAQCCSMRDKSVHAG